MKPKLNTILTLVSLTLTALLLVFVVRAWYAVNKTANVEAGSGATAVGQNLYLSTTYGSNNSFTYSDANMSSGGWATEVNLTASNILLPVSSFDATNFYYTNDINVDGTAIVTEGDYNFNLVTTSASYYYVSKTIWLSTTETEDLNVCLRNVSINQGTDEDSDIYNAVRISVTTPDETLTKIFRSDSTTVYPATGLTTVSNTDPALNSGGQSNSTLSFTVPAATVETVNESQVKTCNVTQVTIKVWVEGQHSDAVATYAGTGFRFNLSFQSY